MELKDYSMEDLLKEVEFRKTKHSLKEFSPRNIGGDSFMIDFVSLLSNAEIGEDGEKVVIVNDVSMYDIGIVYNNDLADKASHLSHLKETYFYDSYEKAFYEHECDLESYANKHGRVNVSIFDILKCVKIVCGENAYIAVCVDD